MKHGEEKSPYYNELSNELFGKPVNRLSDSQMDQLHKYSFDKKNPKWKAIVVDDKPTKYEVSNVGDVRKISTKHVMKLRKLKGGAIGVILSVDEEGETKQHWFHVHDLVAKAFLINHYQSLYVHHLNGNLSLNWIRNLAYSDKPEKITQRASTKETLNAPTKEELEKELQKETERKEKEKKEKEIQNKIIRKIVKEEKKKKEERKKEEERKEILSTPVVEVAVTAIPVVGIVENEVLYTESQLIQMMELVAEDKLSYSEIARITGVKRKLIEKFVEMASILKYID